ncbi:hypothetical protein KY331_01060 [Candidatus Woesearchaeota archaeon]|nr:hypothetical protein [Candidatus Woesearchaeota archaeon]
MSQKILEERCDKLVRINFNKFLAFPKRKVPFTVEDGKTIRGKVSYEFTPEKVYAIGNYREGVHMEWTGHSVPVPDIYRVERAKEGNLLGRKLRIGSQEHNRVLKWMGIPSLHLHRDYGDNLAVFYGFHDGQVTFTPGRNVIEDPYTNVRVTKKEVLKMFE